MIAALRYTINENCSSLIYPVGTYNDINWKNDQPCALGDDFSVFMFKEPEKDQGYMNISNGVDGRDKLRLIETKRYIIKIISKTGESIQLPTLQNEGNKSLKIERDENSVIFQFINYLGISRISFPTGTGVKNLDIEVVPDKMDYEDDYINLTEALAERCAELLLDYSGSTSNLFTVSENNSETLLEQFIFLRQFCYSDNIQSLFETIKRNPDRVLIEEEEFHPFGSGALSKKVFSHPFQYAKNWNRYKTSDGSNYYLPADTVMSRKHDNNDTTANRFLKYALEYFDSVCQNLVYALNLNKAQKQTECLKEAAAIHEMINDILKDHFFDEIGPLDIMPQNNQVLQKREGYSQIFSAYSMIDLALQLDWRGEEDVYKGESKNVALLYEYWLFFELERVIRDIKGCVVEGNEETPFITNDKGKLIISLQEGKKSCQSFHIPDLNIKINLYYNRTFSPSEFRSSKYEGSYSRPFRPDFTLAIFPDKYNSRGFNGENEAVSEGTVSYIHFDAKYRVTDLTSLVGKENENTEELKAELEKEKTEEVVNTYKRGDLLKMHTYNDAIRRTIGSYVLYPGTGSQDEFKNRVFSLYDEILPGVGAFAIKPSISRLGEEEIKKFIINLITEKAHNSSRLNRMGYFDEIVLRDPASSETVRKQFQGNRQIINNISDKLCVIGYMRADSSSDYYSYLKNAGKLNVGSEFYFYYYAIRNGVVYTHHSEIARAGFLRVFTNQISKTGTYCLEPIICTIESSELISKSDLIKRLGSLGYLTDEEHHHADYYYVMKVKIIEDSASIATDFARFTGVWN